MIVKNAKKSFPETDSSSQAYAAEPLPLCVSTWIWLRSKVEERTCTPNIYER